VKQIWDRIHIIDLSDLFALLTEAILDQKSDLPSGKLGYYFAESGFQTWKSISERIGKAGKYIGVFETDEVGDVTLKEAADEFYGGDLRHAEGVLASKYVFPLLISTNRESYLLLQCGRNVANIVKVREQRRIVQGKCWDGIQSMVKRLSSRRLTKSSLQWLRGILKLVLKVASSIDKN
jgi:hypothetical protein